MRSSKSNLRPKSNPLAPPRSHASFRFEAIGTHWTVDIYEPLPAAGLNPGLERDLRERIDTFDKHYSRFRDDSLITRMARKAGKYRLPADARPLFDLYAELYAITGGAMTPLIGQVLADAGYDAAYSFRPRQLRRPPSWDEALDYQFPALTLKRPALLDLGAAGKGYAVDIGGEVLERHGVEAYCIDAGGDIRYRHASAALAVGLEHPDNPAQVIGVAQLTGQSLCGSSGNRRAWGAFHHIMDPFRLESPRHIRALWVTAETTLLADGLATALFFVPAERLTAQYTFEYALVHADYSLERSAHFPAIFYTTPERQL